MGLVNLMTCNNRYLLYLCFLCISLGSTNALANSSLSINEAKQACKNNQVLLATQAFHDLLKIAPQSVDIHLELASCYFYSGYYQKGSRIFKSLINSDKVENHVKINVSKFIEGYKEQISQHTESRKRLLGVLTNKDSISLKAQSIYAYLHEYPKIQSARLKLISLLLKLDRSDEVHQQLELINTQLLDFKDYEAYQALIKIRDNKFKYRTYVSGKGSLTIGYDDNVGGIASNDIYEEDNLTSQEKIGGLFTRWYGSLRYNIVSPSINFGERSHTDLAVFSISAHERSFFDEEGEPRNYNILDFGATYGRKNKDNTQLLLPISIKRIQLNGEEYAQYLDAKLRYSWKQGDATLSLTERFSHRDYSQFDEDRQNANLYEGAFDIGMPMTRRMRLNGKIHYTLLDTTDEEFRSYERFTYGASWAYGINSVSELTLGMKYQTTDYRGVNENLVIPNEECIEEECTPLYDYIRSDDMTNTYIESSTMLNDHFDFKVTINHVDRESNQPLYTYSRQTVTVSINGKF